MQKETNMAVASTMTCKICLLWRHMKTLYTTMTPTQGALWICALGLMTAVNKNNAWKLTVFDLLPLFQNKRALSISAEFCNS